MNGNEKRNLPLLKAGMTCALALMIFSACSEKDEIINIPPAAKANVEFDLDQHFISEFNVTQKIEIKLDRPAPVDASITIRVSGTQATYNEDFTTKPAVNGQRIQVPVVKGATKAEFEFTSIDNPALNQGKNVVFEMESAGQGLQIGNQRQSIMTIADDEQKRIIGFQTVNSEVFENNGAGVEVKILLSDAATANGILKIGFTSETLRLNEGFTVQPAPQNGSLELPIQVGQRELKITLKPVDNNWLNTEGVVKIQITQVTDGFELGNSTVHEVLIRENDAPQLVTLSSLRENYPGGDQIIFNTAFIQGTVLSTTNNLPANVLHLRDGIGSTMQIVFNENHGFQPGEQLRIFIGNTMLRNIDGVLTLGSLPNVFATKIGQELVFTQTVTLQEFFASTVNRESDVFHIRNVTYVEADGVNTMQGIRTITDGTRTMKVITNTNASFRNELVPAGVVDVSGITIERNGEWFIIPQGNDDIK